MPRFYVSVADANRILDTGQERLTLEHAKKLAAEEICGACATPRKVRRA
jgi:hypothetical protein